MHGWKLSSVQCSVVVLSPVLYHLVGSFFTSYGSRPIGATNHSYFLKKKSNKFTYNTLCWHIYNTKLYRILSFLYINLSISCKVYINCLKQKRLKQWLGTAPKGLILLLHVHALTSLSWCMWLFQMIFTVNLCSQILCFARMTNHLRH